ncbi:MAG: DEAD/DEAH box helicase family protein [Succinivibrionaceae bacterium]|nr:DEAD/DEAH box helicase family protein [Succinivibrionaceae bacterium]
MENEFRYEDRPYQVKAVGEIMREFGDHESVLLESPVGSGKTIMGLMVIRRMQEAARARGQALRVNWVAARRHILTQTERINLAHFHCDLNYVSAFASDPPAADLMVIDEAHHEATQSVLNLYERTRNTLTLGLSATPLRTDRMKLSFQVTVKSATIPGLIKTGVLSPYHEYRLNEWDPGFIAAVYLAGRERFGKSLVFFRTVAECTEFALALAEAGVHCEVVTGSSDKERQLEDFSAGRVQVISNVSVLTEGFDVPDLQSVFIRDASRLPTIQMAGRGLRRCAGKDHCNLVQSENTAYSVCRIAEPQKSFRYMQGSWRSCSPDTEAIAKALAEYNLRFERRPKKAPISKAGRDASQRLELNCGGIFDEDLFGI